MSVKRTRINENLSTVQLGGSIDFSDFPSAERVFRYFEDISRVPRCSGNTAPIADYLERFAKRSSLFCYRDEKNNVLIKKPAYEGYEQRPAVILQGHTDMVKQCAPDCSVDMDKEGVILFRSADTLGALGTTLGADDGIAVAYMLAILSDKSLKHPPIEALFTSDEEIGLLGAAAFDCSRLSGRTMINIDSDAEGIFTVGCAGGARVDIELPLMRDIEGGNYFKLQVGGLFGGHSGTEINKGRGNAIKILAEALLALPELKICKISGGNADNAIPRSAEAVFTTKIQRSGELLSLISRTTDKYKTSEPDIHFEITRPAAATLPFTEESSQKIVRLITEEPTGVVELSRDIEGLVETSLNLGIIESGERSLYLTASVRSSKNGKKNELIRKIVNIAKKFGATCTEHGEYPAWEFKKHSHLCDVMREEYERMYGKSPKITTIHAGLECGIFAGKLEGLDCISIGPDNFDIHTTEERLCLSSAARVWIFLLEVLKKL